MASVTEKDSAELGVTQPGVLDSDGPAETGGKDGEEVDATSSWNWATDPSNPHNWPPSRKWAQVGMMAPTAFLASFGSSIVGPAAGQLMEEFDVTTTQALLPLSMYVLALGLGPVVGGPLSETVGRYPVFAIFTPLGLLFTLATGFCHSFAGICLLRFLAGFAFAPSLAVASGVMNETFLPFERALPSTLFVLTPFLGPGMGPVIGAFVVERLGWRWTQWTMLFLGAVAVAATMGLGRETYHPILRQRRARQLGLPLPDAPALGSRLKAFVVVALVRPLDMLVTEPIVSLTSLYVACEFGTLYSFFAAVPYVFQSVYAFSAEQAGLVFLAIVVGCVLGVVTIMACDVLLYRPQVARHPPHMVPPEYRLFPAVMGAVGLPLALFWFGWTARPSVSWASPAVAIVPFAWGNLCLFISVIQYLVDAYHGTTVASAASANSLARYTLSAAFPLFTVQMYQRLGIGWASSLLAFIALALLPVPWAIFRFGKTIRAKSRYETAAY